MDYSKLFYWLTVADDVKHILDIISNWAFGSFIVLGVAFIIMTIMKGVNIAESSSTNEEEDKVDPDIRSTEYVRTIIKRFFIAACILTPITWTAWAAIPTKKEALLIVAGGQTMNFLTSDSSAKQIPHELSSFVVTELKNMAQEAKVDLGINTQKEKVLNEAKKMTGEELIKAIKTDSLLRKTLLK